MTVLMMDPRTLQDAPGLLKEDPKGPNFLTGQPIAENPIMVGIMWPQRKKGSGAGDWEMMDALEPQRRWALSSANPPKLVADGINGTSALSFGDGTTELPGSIEGNGSMRFSDSILGPTGTICLVSRTTAVEGRGTLFATTPVAGGIILSITNAGYFQLQVGGFGQVLRRDLDLRNGLPVMHTVTWRPDPNDAAYSIFNYFVGKGLWSGGSNFRVATRVTSGRPIIGANGDPGQVLTSPLARTLVGEVWLGTDDCSLAVNEPLRALIHARMNWRHQLGL